MKLVDARNFIYQAGELISPKTEQERRWGMISAAVILVVLAVLYYFFT